MMEIALLSIMRWWDRHTLVRQSLNMHILGVMFYRKVQTPIKTLNIVSNNRRILPRSVNFRRKFLKRALYQMRMSFLRVLLFNQVHNSQRISNLHKLMYPRAEHFNKQLTVESNNSSMDLKVELSNVHEESLQTSSRRLHWPLLQSKTSSQSSSLSKLSSTSKTPFWRSASLRQEVHPTLTYRSSPRINHLLPINNSSRSIRTLISSEACLCPLQASPLLPQRKFNSRGQVQPPSVLPLRIKSWEADSRCSKILHPPPQPALSCDPVNQMAWSQITTIVLWDKANNRYSRMASSNNLLKTWWTRSATDLLSKLEISINLSIGSSLTTNNSNNSSRRYRRTTHLQSSWETLCLSNSLLRWARISKVKVLLLHLTNQAKLDLLAHRLSALQVLARMDLVQAQMFNQRAIIISVAQASLVPNTVS